MVRRFRLTCTALVALALVIVFGCSLNRNKPRDAAPPVNASSPLPVTKNPPRVTTAFGPSSNPQADVDGAIKRLGTAYPYRVTFSQTMGQRPAVEFVVEYGAADRFNLRDSSGYESQKRGGDVYSRSMPKESEWIQHTGSGASIGELQERTVQTNLPRPGRDVKLIGKETLNGRECFVYSFKNGAGKVWIGAADGLLYQIDEVSADFKQHYLFEYVDVDV